MKFARGAVHAMGNRWGALLCRMLRVAGLPGVGSKGSERALVSIVYARLVASDPSHERNRLRERGESADRPRQQRRIDKGRENRAGDAIQQVRPSAVTPKPEAEALYQIINFLLCSCGYISSNFAVPTSKPSG